jgi:hypothetical protein
MAIYNNGILGAFSGTVGNVVGSTWRGIPVLRARPVRKNFTVSPLQQEQRERFQMMSVFLRPLSELLNQTFKKSAAGMTCFNKALSENKHAIDGLYPDIKVDYSKIILSRGRLPLGEPPTLISQEAGKLLLNWNTGDGINKLLTAGSAFIAAYCEEFNRWIFGQYTISNGVNSYMLEVAPFAGKQVQAYIGFISKGGQRFSESRYMGQLNILH